MRHSSAWLLCVAALAASALAAAARAPAPSSGVDASEASRLAVGTSSWQLSEPRADGRPLHVDGTPFFDALTATTQPVAGYEGSREAVIAHPGQDSEAKEKLDALGGNKKPNILIFLMDDVGWGDLGAYGGGAAVGSPTPNLDKAVRGGLQLTSTYAQPTCSPTRGSLLTGRLPMRHGLLRPPMAGEKGGLEGEITIANVLQKAGYATSAVGKWHVGENNASQPQNVGFDASLMFMSVANVYTEWRDPRIHPDIVSRPARTKLAADVGFQRNLVRTRGAGAPQELLGEIDIPMSEQLDDWFANYSVDVITAAKDGGKPWFHYHATSGCEAARRCDGCLCADCADCASTDGRCHFDIYPGRWAGASPAAYPYPDCLVHMDALFGRLMDTLERTGQANNTLVFVTSDNGPEMETWPDSGRTPFRGSKGSTWEGGVRVPGIAYWPGTIAPGRISDGLFDLTDLFATAATLACVPEAVPKDRYIDSVDQTGFLLADRGVSARKWVYYWLQGTFSAVRVMETKFYTAATYWEYMQDNHNPGGLSGDITTFQTGHLFNLFVDPQERHNELIRQLPFLSLYQDAIKSHAATFTKYPPKVTVSLERGAPGRGSP